MYDNLSIKSKINIFIIAQNHKINKSFNVIQKLSLIPNSETLFCDEKNFF